MKYQEFIRRAQDDLLELIRTDQIDPKKKSDHIRVLNCQLSIDVSTDEIVEVCEKF
jgi:hypothetical protein